MHWQARWFKQIEYFASSGIPLEGLANGCMCGFIGSHLKTKTNQRGATKAVFQQFAMWPCSRLVLQKTELRHRRLRQRGRFLDILVLQTTKNKGYLKTKRGFFRISMKSYDVCQPSFFIGKAYMFEHRNLSKNLFRYVLLDFEKRLKIDHFQRCISEHSPIAYGGIHMKLLNLKLFISKAFTF